MNWKLPFVHISKLALIAALLLSGCGDDATRSSDADADADADVRPAGFARPEEIVVREDDIAYRDGEDLPFTGAAVTRDKDWMPQYFAYYFQGRLHGPETRWYSDGKLKRIFDYNHGEKTRHREWWENGEPKLDAMTRDGVAFGRHIKYNEEGKETFVGNFAENLQWHGHIRDVGADGTVLWDAEFDHGYYLRGIYPESEKQNLIDAGMLDKDGKLIEKED